MRNLDIILDERSALPVYAQVRDQLLHLLARGALRGGDRLPAMRDLASTLGINPNTVNRAYAELEREGVLKTRRGRGTFVAQRAKAAPAPHRHRLLDLAERFVAHARSLGFDPETIARAVEAQLRKQRSQRAGG